VLITLSSREASFVSFSGISLCRQAGSRGGVRAGGGCSGTNKLLLRILLLLTGLRSWRFEGVEVEAQAEKN
jgi:hypothetical protein